MIIYLCENCMALFWSKTTLSEHQKKHINGNREYKIKKKNLIWRRYDFIVKNKSSLQHGMGYNKCVSKASHNAKVCENSGDESEYDRECGCKECQVSHNAKEKK